ncbi:MAG: beta-N-acetylhexosaminidase [Lachnospiraceae bacterium]|nr:beta-N-acetylhexosaminidase [Lachnospiraceae bacterium]
MREYKEDRNSGSDERIRTADPEKKDRTRDPEYRDRTVSPDGKDRISDDDAEERRLERRRRHKREQLISVIVLLLIISVVAVLVSFGVSGIVKYLNKNPISFSFGKNSAETTVSTEGESALSGESAAPETHVTLEAPVATESASAEETETDYLSEVVEQSVSQMTLEEKVSGLFILTPEQLTGVSKAIKVGDKTKEALSKFHPGGIVYQGKNITDREQITQMIADTEAVSKYPLFICVTEEGGNESPVSSALQDLTEASDERSSENAADAMNAGRAIGSYLSEIGFNMDLAPVADLVTEEAGKESAARSYGSDPAHVTEMISSAVNGLQSGGVGACAKYFPGMGDSLGKGDHVVIEKTAEELKQSDILPFEAAIANGVTAIMISNACYTGIDSEEIPASLSSSIIKGMLREELGFEGIVITGDLSEKAVSSSYESGEAAVMALKAGADMLFIPENYEKAYEAVLAAVQSGEISEEDINTSIRRIYRVKCSSEVSNLSQ